MLVINFMQIKIGIKNRKPKVIKFEISMSNLNMQNNLFIYSFSLKGSKYICKIAQFQTLYINNLPIKLSNMKLI